MKTRKFPILLVLGSFLVFISILLIVVFQVRIQMGAANCRNVISKIEEVLPERTAGVPGMYPSSGMPVLEIEKTDYVAVLEIPSFGLTLPVVDKWDRGNLSHGPARFFGSVYEDTLIIGGIDDARQFGFCNTIQQGAQITVTDMTGKQFSYTVSGINRAKHAETQWLTGEDCDLTLFCHDMYAMEYIAVRCHFVYG